VVIVMLGGVVMDLLYSHVVGEVRIPANGKVHAPIEALLAGTRQGPLQAGHHMIHQRFMRSWPRTRAPPREPMKLTWWNGLVAAFNAAAKPRETPRGNRLRV